MPFLLHRAHDGEDTGNSRTAPTTLDGEMSDEEYLGDGPGASPYQNNFILKPPMNSTGVHTAESFEGLKKLYRLWASGLKGSHYACETHPISGPALMLTLLDPRDIAVARGYWRDIFHFDEMATIHNIDETLVRAGLKSCTPETPRLRRHFAAVKQTCRRAREEINSFRPRPPV